RKRCARSAHGSGRAARRSASSTCRTSNNTWSRTACGPASAPTRRRCRSIDRASSSGPTAAVRHSARCWPKPTPAPASRPRTAITRRAIHNYYSRPAPRLILSLLSYRGAPMAATTPMYGRKHQKGLNLVTTVAMIGFHAGAVAALFFIDGGAMLSALLLYCVAGMLGIGMGYHRLLTHRGYKTYKWLEYALTWCGTLALEGGPIFWVATHRIHHQHSDREGYPHTPREGTWWAHAGWILS